MDEQRYLVNRHPTSARGLISLAAEMSAPFARKQIKCTSEAAAVLRSLGYVVSDREEEV